MVWRTLFKTLALTITAASEKRFSLEMTTKGTL
jgi:hypothetical protein